MQEVRAACEAYQADNSVRVTGLHQEDGRRAHEAEAGCSEALPIVSGYVLTGLSALSFLERIGITVNPNQATAALVRADVETQLRERYGPAWPYNDEFFRMVRNESQRLGDPGNREDGDPKVVRNLTRL